MEYNTARPKITLPPDVYDTYELSALANGGVAAGHYADGKDRPACIFGHYYMLTGGVCGVGPDDSAKAALFPNDYGLYVTVNDNIVKAVNMRKGRKNRNARITWAEYCAEGNIHRGEVRDVAA